MPFSIYAMGSKADADRAVCQSKAYGDSSHHDALQEAIRKIIDTLPEDATVAIECDGGHDFSQPAGTIRGRISLKIRMG